MFTWIPRNHFIAIALAFLVIHALLFQIYGLRNLYDAVSYVKSANNFLNDGTLVANHHFFYSLHVILLAGFLILFDSNLIPFLLFQSVVSFFAILYLYRGTSNLFSRNVALIAALVFVFWWDNIHWNTTTMTESLFCSAGCFLLYRLTVFAGRKREYWFLIALLLLCLFLRPTGILFVAGTVVFLMTYYWSQIRSNKLMATSLAIGLGLVIIFSLYELSNMWDFTGQYVRGNIVTYVDQVKSPKINTDGLRVIPGDADVINDYENPAVKLIVFIYHNPAEFFTAAVLKIFYLLSGYRPYYSMLHNVVTASWMVAIYSAFAVGISRVSNTPLKYFILTVIALNCLLIGISSVDWDNRFYIPMEAGIVVVSSVGLNIIIRNVLYLVRSLELLR